MKEIKQVLITGVAGFIGSNLLDFIIDQTDWRVHGIDNLSTGNKDNIAAQLDHDRFTFIEMRVSELKSVKQYEVVFHLAALPRIQPSFEAIIEHVDANLNEALSLIELMVAEDHFPRLVYSGSSSIYGNPELVPTPESESIKCMNPYAFQKYEVEKYLELLSDRYPLNYITLRYFNPYGPRSFNPLNSFNAYSSVIGIFLNRRSQDNPLYVTGDGSQRRDFIHVRDVAAANVAAAQASEFSNTAYNIGQGDTMSVLELAQQISTNIEFIEMRKGEADITHADNTKAKDELKWQPAMNLSAYLKDEIALIDSKRN
jgi:UDP-glucose 4-epimerase